MAEQERSQPASHTASCLLCLLCLVPVQPGVRAVSEGRHLSLPNRTRKQGQPGLLQQRGLMLLALDEHPVPNPPSTFPFSLLMHSKELQYRLNASKKAIFLVDILILRA